MKAAGRWTWWSNWTDLDNATCVRRAKEANVDGVITKANFWPTFDAFKAAGIPLGIEAYVVPDDPSYWGNAIADGLQRGALFAVINAETNADAPWQNYPAATMEKLIATIQNRAPKAELYASVDTRAGRMTLPYQQVLAKHIAGWMPMIYPLAFLAENDRELNRRPADYVARAFQACVDSGQDFHGKPVLPTIQTYDGIGQAGVVQEIAEVHRRRFVGYQAYTVGSATDDEWAAFAADAMLLAQEEDDMVVGQFATSIPWDKSYIVTVGKEGARKTLVASKAEYESLLAAGFPVKQMDAKKLATIISAPGTPEPNTP